MASLLRGAAARGTHPPARLLRHTTPPRLSFHAMVVQSAKTAGAGRTAELASFDRLDQLPRQDPAADVEVGVTHSTLNYKDGLIVLGKPGVVRNFPIVAGIDYAGVVRASRSAALREGDAVVLTGNKAGQYFDGGYAQRAACQAEWLVRLPAAFDAADAMTIGTAGVTAMMCVRQLERVGGLKADYGPVLVTGAAGGLGQLAVAILAKRGYHVIASTGRVAEQQSLLQSLGATEVIGRLEAVDKPLGPQRWVGVVDSVGGATLAAAAAQTMYGGAIASTGAPLHSRPAADAALATGTKRAHMAGVAGGGQLETTVYPFILRGVRLLGVDSTLPWRLDGYPQDEERWLEWRKERLGIWEDLSDTLTRKELALVHAGSIELKDVYDHAQKILDGKIAGRLVVDIPTE